MSGTGAARERAAGFVLVHGAPLERARARAALAGTGADTVLSLLGPPPSEVAALRDRLAICEELRALRSPSAQQCAEALAGLQRQDGGFGGASLALEERLRLTGSAGGSLARSPFARPETLEAAGSFLAAHFTPDLLQGFQWENLAAYAHYFSNALHEASDEILQWCGRELERGFRTREFDAVRTAQVLLRCDAHALPGARLEPQELVLALVTEQAGDGSFGTAGPPAGRVEATLQGLRALGFLDNPARAR